MSSVVSLLTDFGNQDSYVAEMKAILLAIKGIQFVDVTHEVPPFDIRRAAFQLLRSYAFFPKGTVHLVVVDPGVGSERRALYVKTKDFHFVGPDNGVLRWAVEHCEERERKKATVFEIPMPSQVSRTFHGRDVFAPFVVKLLKKKLPRLKLSKEKMEGAPFPKIKKLGKAIHGEILSVDRFGNIITSIPYEKGQQAEAQVGGWRSRIASVPSYSSIGPGQAALICGSHGFWEIASKNASAFQLLNEAIGDRVTLFVKR